MLSNAYFLAKFRFDTAENEPAKNLHKLCKTSQNLPIMRTLTFRIPAPRLLGGLLSRAAAQGHGAGAPWNGHGGPPRLRDRAPDPMLPQLLDQPKPPGCLSSIHLFEEGSNTINQCVVRSFIKDSFSEKKRKRRYPCFA